LNKIPREPSRKLKISKKVQHSLWVRIILGVCDRLLSVLQHLPCHYYFSARCMKHTYRKKKILSICSSNTRKLKNDKVRQTMGPKL